MANPLQSMSITPTIKDLGRREVTGSSTSNQANRPSISSKISILLPKVLDFHLIID
jgi:hypothetical protein